MLFFTNVFYHSCQSGRFWQSEMCCIKSLFFSSGVWCKKASNQIHQLQTERPKLFPSLLWPRLILDTGYQDLALASRLSQRQEWRERYSHLSTLFGKLPWSRESVLSPYYWGTWVQLLWVNDITVNKLLLFFSIRQSICLFVVWKVLSCLDLGLCLVFLKS